MIRVAVIMAGGKGSRFGGPEKPLAKICGRPMISWVAYKAEKVSRNIILAVSGRTRDLCRLFTYDHHVICIETSGNGYVEDLALLLRILQKPVLVLPADTPLIPLDILMDFVGKALNTNSDIAEFTIVKDDSKRELIGVSVFFKDAGREEEITYPYSIVLSDIDTQEELSIARQKCTDTRWM